MTQEALAALLEIEPGTLSRYEQGHVALTVPLLVAAARALRVEPASLVAGLGASPAAKDGPEELDRLWAGLTSARKEAVLALMRTIQGM